MFKPWYIYVCTANGNYFWTKKFLCFLEHPVAVLKFELFCSLNRGRITLSRTDMTSTWYENCGKIKINN